MNVTLTVPVGWLQQTHPMFDTLKYSEASRRRMVTELLYQCEAHFGIRSVLPASPSSESGASMRISLYLTERLARYVAAVAQLTSALPGATCKALLHHLWKHKPAGQGLDMPSASTNALVHLLKRLDGIHERAEQVSAFNAIEDALRRGQIGLVEASTGVGKTLAYVYAAARWVQQEGASCCVAVPTIALMRQVIAEYRRIEAAAPLPPMRTFFGKREFVSHAEAAAFKDMAKWPAVQNWIEAGARPRLDDGVEPPWLAGELRMQDDSFPVSEVLLSDLSGPDDAGYRAYRAQFTEPAGPSLLLCTHAMLAQDMRLRLRAAARDPEYVEVNKGVFEILASLRGATGGQRAIAAEQLDAARQQMGDVLAASDRAVGILPSYAALVVDEAHALESNFSSALSEYLSLRKVVRQLAAFRAEGGRVSAAALQEADDAVSVMQQGGDASGLVPLRSTSMDRARAAMSALAGLLAPIAAVKLRSPTPQRALLLAELRRALNLIRYTLDRGISRAFLRLSPHRSYPQLFVGRDSVDSVLQLLWSSTRAGVAISATLYLYRSTGPHAGYISGLLGISDARRSEYAPIEARWLADSIVRVDFPAGDRATRLRPPNVRDRLTDDESERRRTLWHDAVAEDLTRIHSDSAGGVLVLNTSYETVDALYARLAPAQEAVVRAEAGTSVAQQAKRFLELQDRGLRPLWLAVGAAWTGLDVGGHEPRTHLLGKHRLEACDDNVLTDLVITRLPFGTNNSISHLRRMKLRPTIPWDTLDAGFRFRQALGRLVRRRGLPSNRRVWVLDGRLGDSDAAAGLALFLAPLKRLQEHVAAREGP